MGLDMYAYAINADVVEDLPDIDEGPLSCPAAKMLELLHPDLPGEEGYDPLRELGYESDFGYWRKFEWLNNWMHELYLDKGGTKEFNCTFVRIYPEDLVKLEGSLVACPAFPFAERSDPQEIPQFIRKCRHAFANNKAVFYSNWW